MSGLFGTMARAASANPSLFGGANLAEDFYGRRGQRQPMDERNSELARINAMIDADPRVASPEAMAWAKQNPAAYLQAATQQGGGEARPAPDYSVHYAMHGRGADGSVPGSGKKRGTGEKILRGLVHGFQAYGAARGDPASLYALKERRARRSAGRKEEAGFGAHDRYVRAMMAEGMSHTQAELAASNMERFGAEYNTRFRTDDLAPDHERASPRLGGGFDTYRAGKTIENGPDVVRVHGQSGFAPPPQLGGFGSPPALGGFQPGAPLPQIPGVEGEALPPNPNFSVVYKGRTEAERAALESGYQPGTPQYRQFMQNLHLKGQGPTAFQMHREDNETSRYGADVGARTATRGQDLTDSRGRFVAGVQSETTRRGQDIGAATTRGSHAYKAGGGRAAGRGATPGGGADRIGQIYTRGNLRIQYSKSAGGYVDIATGRKVQ